ncbi:MAG: VWA domain-containing protein [Cytophagales bacterium]|nr:MAG: VWA domain-containing protein [Cytophagales bacterium]
MGIIFFYPTILNKNLIKWINTEYSTIYDENKKANKSIMRFDFLILNKNIKEISLEKEIIFKYFNLKINKLSFLKPKNIVVTKSILPVFNNLKKSNFDINYCIDVSGSMSIKDVEPNRFEVVRKGILNFLQNYSYINSTSSISF